MGTVALTGKGASPGNDKEGAFVFQAVLLQEYSAIDAVFLVFNISRSVEYFYALFCDSRILKSTNYSIIDVILYGEN